MSTCGSSPTRISATSTSTSSAVAKCVPRATSRVTVSTIAGCAWPKGSAPNAIIQSIYSRPSTSYSREPAPWLMYRGAPPKVAGPREAEDTPSTSTFMPRSNKLCDVLAIVPSHIPCQTSNRRLRPRQSNCRASPAAFSPRYANFQPPPCKKYSGLAAAKARLLTRADSCL
ncbi:MAG: hypothetical protein ACD_54C01275G0001 [uncultured bacterium]|nr:MAG: hypothetical protein ACD_54C01275G0001 [uncultured bacterium]